jgi:hypothetical protein
VWVAGNEDDAGTVLYSSDGGTWADSGSFPTTLTSIWGTSDSEVWLVGGDNYIREWTGSAWSIPMESFSDTANNELTAVWGTSQDNVWAVSNNQILEWMGASWVAAPTTMGYSLTSLWGSSATDVWAAGYGEIAHLVGTQWSSVDVPSLPDGASSTSLTGIWGSGPNDIWAVSGGGYILHHP